MTFKTRHHAWRDYTWIIFFLLLFYLLFRKSNSTYILKKLNICHLNLFPTRHSFSPFPTWQGTISLLAKTIFLTRIQSTLCLRSIALNVMVLINKRGMCDWIPYQPIF